MTVDPVNDAPVVEALNLEIDEDTDLVIGVADLLANARDADDDELSVTAVGNEVGGTVVLNENGTITFTPAENYNGPAGFRYTVSDGTTTIDGTVNVTVGPVNDAAQITGDDTGTINEDSTLPITGRLTVEDVDGDDSVTPQTDVDGEYGTFSIAAAGDWTYTLNNNLNAVQALGEGESRTDTIRVAAADGTSQDIVITINGTNDAATFGGNTGASIGYVLGNTDVVTASGRFNCRRY